ncbi:hypothetical protein HAHE_07340 [Haloferula helveola]|uniref:Uncharacterized protein n=1 Tax=Haloferula helveola TaxID=490095 RepID=A0ABM7R9N3_9BACT|nr:hypothetical protein HAHE_07340 [Haloferula helveola]
MKAPILLLALVAAGSVSARTFTSADGSKTIEADLIDFNPSTGNVVLRYDGTVRNVTVSASAFSEEDQEYFGEFLKDEAKRNSLNISTDEESEDVESGEGGLYIYEKSNSHYRVKVSNRGSVDIEDLTVKYDIYVSRYDKAGDKNIEVVSGEGSIDKVLSQFSEEVESESVTLTEDCETTSSCPKCKAQAASVKRERLIGIHVRLYDDEGELLTEHYSSNSVKSAAEKKARES